MCCDRGNHIGASQNKQLGRSSGLFQSFFFTHTHTNWLDGVMLINEISKGSHARETCTHKLVRWFSVKRDGK